MRQFTTALATGGLLLSVAMAGCASGPAVNKEASSSAIRAAEEVGASKVPSASYYLQLAKEESEKGKAFAGSGDRDRAESMLSRAQADAELAVALSRGDADKTEAAQSMERVRKLREDNKLPQERK